MDFSINIGNIGHQYWKSRPYWK